MVSAAAARQRKDLARFKRAVMSSNPNCDRAASRHAFSLTFYRLARVRAQGGIVFYRPPICRDQLVVLARRAPRGMLGGLVPVRVSDRAGVGVAGVPLRRAPLTPKRLKPARA